MSPDPDQVNMPDVSNLDVGRRKRKKTGRDADVSLAKRTCGGGGEVGSSSAGTVDQLHAMELVPVPVPRPPGERGVVDGAGKTSAFDIDAYQEDSVTLLRAAIELRGRTGALPKNPSVVHDIFEAVKGSLRDELTEKKVFNRFRTLRFNLENGRGVGGDLVRQLSAELWNLEEDDLQKKKKKKKRGPLSAEEQEALPHLAEVLKKHGLSIEMLDKKDLAGAQALEEKWKKLVGKLMKFEIQQQKLHIEIRKVLLETHQSEC